MTAAEPGRWRLRWAGYTAVLFASWTFNPLGLPDPHWFDEPRPRAGSLGCEADLTASRVARAGPGVHPLHPLVYKAPDGSPVVYRSQFGLGGVLLGGLRAALPVPAGVLLWAAAAGLALLTAAAVGLLFATANRWLPAGSGDLACGLAACSPVLLPFAPSIYLFTPLLLAPFVLVWCLFPRATTPARRAALAAGVGLLVGVKALAGYEYITVVILAPVAAAWFHQVRGGEPIARRVAVAASLVAAGVAGFGLAVGGHALQLRILFDEDGLAVIRQRAAERTSATDLGTAGADGNRLRYATGRFLGYFDRPALTGPGFLGSRPRVPLKAVVGVAAACGAGLLVARRRLPPAAVGLAGACAVGLAAGLSWQVLAVNHMCLHPHLNPVVFAVPFLPLAFILVGATAGWAGAGPGLGRGVLVTVVGLAVANGAVEVIRGRAEAAAGARAEATVVDRLHVVEPLADGRVVGAIDGVGPIHTLDRHWVLWLDELDFETDRPADPGGVVIRGWAVGVGPDRRADVVVTYGGRPVPARVCRRPDFDQAAGRPAPGGGFLAVVPSSAVVPGERPRVFAVSRGDPPAVAELPHAGE